MRKGKNHEIVPSSLFLADNKVRSKKGTLHRIDGDDDVASFHYFFYVNKSFTSTSLYSFQKRLREE